VFFKRQEEHYIYFFLKKAAMTQSLEPTSLNGDNGNEKSTSYGKVELN
jgi:hypothetical protein